LRACLKKNKFINKYLVSPWSDVLSLLVLDDLPAVLFFPDFSSALMKLLNNFDYFSVKCF